MDLVEYIGKNFDKFILAERILLNNINSDIIRKNINIIEDGIPLLSKISKNINKNNMSDITDVHGRLKKNIIESLLVEQPLYNNVKNISGPLRICYFYNKKLNKKIILLGDMHIGIDFSCPKDSIMIENYLHELFKLDFDIDLFIEADLPIKKYLKKKDLLGPLPKDYKPEDDHSYNWEPGYLSEIRKFGYRNYKKKEGKRVHLTDLRDDEITGFYKLAMFQKAGIEKVDDYKKYTRENHKFILSMKKYFESNGKVFGSNIPKHLIKELNKLQESSNKDVVNKIKNYILRHIEYYESYFKKENIDKAIIHGISEVDIIHTIFDVQFRLNAVLSDIYTIARIMKSTEFNNNILYYGDAHVSNLIILLELIDFKVKDIKKSKDYEHCQIKSPINTSIDCDEFRCIRDIIQFDKFFKKV